MKQWFHYFPKRFEQIEIFIELFSSFPVKEIVLILLFLYTFQVSFVFSVKCLVSNSDLLVTALCKVSSIINIKEKSSHKLIPYSVESFFNNLNYSEIIRLILAFWYQTHVSH